jgi:hypothetical protein
MAKRPVSHGKGWTKADLAVLKQLAKQTTAKAAARTLGRTPEAIQQKAMRSGISFQPGHRAAMKKK